MSMHEKPTAPKRPAETFAEAMQYLYEAHKLKPGDPLTLGLCSEPRTLTANFVSHKNNTITVYVEKNLRVISARDLLLDDKGFYCINKV